MEFSYTKSTDTSTNMVTKDYSKSRMRENRTYGSVRGGQSNLIPSTRLTAALLLRVVVGAYELIEGASLYKTIQPPCGRGNAIPLWWLAPPPFLLFEGALWVLSHGAMPLKESIETYSAPACGGSPVQPDRGCICRRQIIHQNAYHVI